MKNLFLKNNSAYNLKSLKLYKRYQRCFLVQGNNACFGFGKVEGKASLGDTKGLTLTLLTSTLAKSKKGAYAAAPAAALGSFQNSKTTFWCQSHIVSRQFLGLMHYENYNAYIDKQDHLYRGAGVAYDVSTLTWNACYGFTAATLTMFVAQAMIHMKVTSPKWLQLEHASHTETCQDVYGCVVRLGLKSYFLNVHECAQAYAYFKNASCHDSAYGPAWTTLRLCRRLHTRANLQRQLFGRALMIIKIQHTS